ncbi:hypothetical protein [Nitrosomonas communis]|uniref:hypothetical protein n=1 Tax=Nitrosomonas communis TaxID=44574 RepID=UPI003D2CF286
MNAKMTSLVAGLALLAGVSVANAQEPMRLSETSMDGVTAGTYNYSPFNFYKDVYTDVDHKLNVWKDVDSTVYVKGQLADAEAGAACYAPNCLTETLTVTNTGWNGPTTSYSESLSATSYPYPY